MGISHIDITKTIYCYPIRMIKLAVPSSIAPPLGCKTSAGSKFLDAVIYSIRYIDITRTIVKRRISFSCFSTLLPCSYAYVSTTLSQRHTVCTCAVWYHPFEGDQNRSPRASTFDKTQDPSSFIVSIKRRALKDLAFMLPPGTEIHFKEDLKKAWDKYVRMRKTSSEISWNPVFRLISYFFYDHSNQEMKLL